MTWIKIKMLYSKGWRINKEGFTQEDRKRLPKSKCLAKFPIGLHVILELRIKIQNLLESVAENYLIIENLLGSNLAPLSKQVY